MDIISRARWGARYSAGFGSSPLPARELWLHHSVTSAPPENAAFDQDAAAVRVLEDIGQQRFGGGISYTFAITPSGRIFEGHGVGRQGAHTGGRNDIARAIVLVGDYSTRAPTAAQKRAVAWLVQHGRRQGWWTVTGLSGGHRQAPNQIATACPGDAALREIPTINRLATDVAAGRVDLDEEDDVSLTTQQDNWLLQLYKRLVETDGIGAAVGAAEKRLGSRLDDMAGRVSRLETSGVPVTVDYKTLAAELADELDRRSRDGNPTTGPTS